MIAVIVILSAFVVLVLCPALIAWLLLFGRHSERTVADLEPEGTYYAPYADEMLAAERELQSNPSLRRVETESEDGVRLCADLIPGDGDRAVILAHGFVTAPTKNFGIMAKAYLAAGYTVLMLHLRGHGPSGGRHVALGAAEWRDVMAWVRWCRENLACRHLVLHGASMGATAVGCTADRVKGTGVRALVMDCGFISPWIQLKQQARRWHIPYRVTLPAVNLLVRASTGADLRKSVRDAVRAAEAPVFFAHGTADTTVLPEQARANYESCSSEKELLMVDGAEHTLALIAGGEEARAKVLAFLDRQIEAAEAAIQPDDMNRPKGD